MSPVSTVQKQLDRVTCRPSPLLWFVVLFLAGCGGFIAAAPWLDPKFSVHSNNTSLALLFGAGCIAVVLCFAVWVVRSVVIADDSGLRWRIGFGGWREARWNEVSDFYEERLAKGQKATVFITPAGRLMISNESWIRLNALRELATQKANEAATPVWAERGKRDAEAWPLIFDYNTGENMRQAPALIAFVVVGTLLYLATLAPKFTKTIQEMGWAWGLGMIAMSSLVILMMPLLFCLLALPVFLDARKRRAQRITATADALTYEDGDRVVRAPWEDITACIREGGNGVKSSVRYLIQSRQGTFEFTGTIGQRRLLVNLLERLAPEAMERGKSQSVDAENLRADRAQKECGAHIYHYRTRTNRALLWFLSTFAILPLLCAWLTMHGLTKAQDPKPLLVVATSVLVPTCWLWWRYFAGSLRTDELGITQTTPFGKRTLYWSDIQDFYISGSDIFTSGNIIGYKGRIRFAAFLSETDRLKKEIVRRAVNCKTREWERREIGRRSIR